MTLEIVRNIMFKFIELQHERRQVDQMATVNGLIAITKACCPDDDMRLEAFKFAKVILEEFLVEETS